jgi:Mlc titration factor MtfA (ptsG expression regulator)
MNRFQRWWLQRFLRKHRIPLSLWEAAVSQAVVLERLNTADRHRLRELASRFLHNKSLVGVQDLEVTDEMRVLIAAQACLLILNLDFSYFAGWYEVIIYPDTFIVDQKKRDEAGVVHQTRHALGGEAWGQGPVILSWRDIQPGAYPHRVGTNVIIHEFAHKLDMLNGAANGMPPLHSEMSRPVWTETLSTAYADFQLKLLSHNPAPINPYAVESPAEFFAVLTELFFELPQRLQETYPKVYEIFRQFYRQDPLSRIGPV